MKQLCVCRLFKSNRKATSRGRGPITGVTGPFAHRFWKIENDRGAPQLCSLILDGKPVFMLSAVRGDHGTQTFRLEWVVYVIVRVRPKISRHGIAPALADKHHI